MNKNISDGLSVAERCIWRNESFYTKYTPTFFIDNEHFAAAMKRLGGYVYNTSVGKVGTVIIFNGYTWLSVHDVPSYEDCDMWAKKVEMEIYKAVGAISPIHIHHPIPGLYSWGIEFNRDKPFWDNPADQFVVEARKLLGSSWFYRSGSDHPDRGYQFFEFMGTAEKSSFDNDEYIVRGQAIQIAKKIGSIVMV